MASKEKPKGGVELLFIQDENQALTGKYEKRGKAYKLKACLFSGRQN